MKKVDYEYYEWLISQIHIPNGKSYNDLFDRMHNLEFIWTVANDENRIQDGLDLRSEFLDGSRSGLDLQWVTFLEVLIGLSRRVAFTASGEAPRWAWRLMKNLRLHKMFDPLTDTKSRLIDEILHDVIWRTYQADGRGGFFPLSNPMDDQTKVEIWYQMNTYVMEMHES